ncbi:MAG TPA: LysR substrate-binding domain-containing protein [Acetobacteraceae bacterium]|nr:LysR substrate-binding domain-containing protein [Acetobacteraceae bacterium]
MEMRHLRYFVAVAEEGGFTRAAERRLHTAQPSLSRQIRDLETSLDVQLIDRGPRGMALTAAGQVFLEHARLILSQAEAAADAARRAARPAKTPFRVGFLTGHEIGWLPKVLELLHGSLPDIELTIHSASSPELMHALIHGNMDLAFLRRDDAAPQLAFKPLIEEVLFLLMPAGHRLAKRKAIRVADIRDETFISFSAKYSPVLRRVIDDCLAQAGVSLAPAHEAETLPMVISLILATGGVTLLPAYMERLLPPSVASRPLLGKVPTITLALGYSKNNSSPLLARFIANADALYSPRHGRA